MSYRVGYTPISMDIFALTIQVPEFQEAQFSWWVLGISSKPMSVENSLGRGVPVPWKSCLACPRALGTWMAARCIPLQLNLPELVNVK